MNPRVQVKVATAGIGPATLRLTGPLVPASGIAVYTNNAAGPELLLANGISITKHPKLAGIYVLEIGWFEVANLRIVKFQVEAGSGDANEYSVTVTGPIDASALEILP